MADLYAPTSVGKIDVNNRVFMAPLTRNRAKDDYSPHDLAAKYYSQRASGGLIITEATQINEEAVGYINTPGLYTQQHVKAWKEVTDTVHEKGGKIVVQLWHVGRISHTSLLPDGMAPLAPSAIQAKSQTFIADGMVDVSAPREMTAEDIQRTISDFKHAAQCAKDAGFDGIEVHGANGYLIDQFLMDSTNKRTDDYGGSPEKRFRFLQEILDGILEVWDAGRVGIRLSPTGKFNDAADSNIAKHFSYYIDRLKAYELAYLHIVETFPGIENSDEETQIVQDLRDQWDRFYIANGGYDKDSAEEMIASGKADAISFGRPYLANPDLPERLRAGAPLNEPDESTFYGGGAEGYTDYPFLDPEKVE